MEPEHFGLQVAVVFYLNQPYFSHKSHDLLLKSAFLTSHTSNGANAMQNDVYDYTQPAGTGAVQKTPCCAKPTAYWVFLHSRAAGAFLSSQTGINLYTMFGNRWIAFGVTRPFSTA